jgi:CheY-like chemotaxis protein
MNLESGSKPRPISERLAACLRRGSLIVAAAGDYCAAGERAAAWQAYCLAQSQYRTATEMLVLSHDQAVPKREEMQVELGALRDAMAKLYACINDAGPEPRHNNPGGTTPNPEIFRNEVIASGRRLSEALKLEDEFSRLSAAETECVRSQLREARKLVELSQRDYDNAVMRYRDALRSCDPPDAPPVRKTVLVLEDEQLVASYLTAVLERYGLRVIHAPSGGRAVALCEHQHVKIDLLVADVILSSGAYGIDVANRLSCCRPDLPILFISGSPLPSLANRALLDSSNRPFGKTDFLQKPFSPAALETRVRLLLSA